MNRIKDYSKLENHIVKWMNRYLSDSGMKGWVLGVSGGLDSAVASTLAAKTGAPVMVLEMPIKQGKKQVSRGKDHIEWLKKNFDNVDSREIDLDINCSFDSVNYLNHSVFDLLIKQVNGALDIVEDTEIANLAEANSRSRLRMLMLYYTGTITSSLVLGTGNKVEDFGVGFYTKYGDGGVDLSPLGDLYKTEVRELGKHMKILDSIITCKPTDGLWDDDRSDEDQLGATYENFEWAMEFIWGEGSELHSDAHEKKKIHKIYDFNYIKDSCGEEKVNALKILIKRYNANNHKMVDIPIYEVPKNNLQSTENLFV